ncbi:mannose-1-phosphate guanylyltransferase/mannose-6-phosphate isomerase [Vibrio parahaemolyticus]|uniref:mannose-1-phosphate guanylyltransferase n=8 Tax=Vibrio parahaemolyticus TaxID=670 RepID=A0A7M1WC87_VIBPH|nr:mannose-1-phosphate guanylyltransferase/mannose-6-phosphate isomerase [Vibrio parahaemolyticus]ELC3155754.1 mannose-1-phosphate guanylyltransferase/mannose-6-phosphate isomerase [Vibrio harveyi]OOI02262.1 mannose-1-phosphate guanylyltransferase/mannose-6-phosphate isomerase [Vibrio sp. OULL4]EGR3111604.1 mannose-1-phosphate guanylyltransferase/mannose-6-phosphate isomerase [Vibrio parahaemolyticus]EHH2554864.1 mannose-1-phosphate guanylyltransferase/mannose-6-phosphate isomerase [Vibrio para
MIYPIIMAGGSGSRLWPLSRELYPKQFLAINSNLSMLQKTFQRLSNIEHFPPMVICNEDHRFILAEQIRLGGYKHSGIILEPIGRNTAPAIALAALQALKENEDPILLVLPADHMIEDEVSLSNSISDGEFCAESGELVTFGIIPDSPETGYGYIKRGLARDKKESMFKVDSFVEKPKLELAEKYVESGEYYWNSGMFMFKASKYLDELKRYRPEIYQSCKRSLEKVQEDCDFIRVDQDEFKNCPDDSIDYAVMENTNNATVIPVSVGWSDIGSWSALWDKSFKDDNQNVQSGDIISVESYGNYLRSESKLVAAVGVKNLIVVETKDAILVADKNQVQEVKSVVSQLKKSNRTEHLLHREVYRPWGKYDSIDSGNRDHVKRITVNPGEKLSIQMHHHRSEHWIVVSGTAKVTNGEKTFLVTEDQSTYIPLGTVHALENPGKIPLEMIEVQTGSYLGEDDIVRFEDRYGRLDK